VEHISSRQNPLVKRIRELSHGRGADDEVLLDGPHLLDEACRSNVEVTLAAFASDAIAGRLADTAARAAAHGARLVTMPPALLEGISPVATSTGVLAIARVRRSTLEDALTRTPALLIVLDAVQDPGNVGAIIRTAEACGATAVIVGPGTADPFGWKAVRGAMGSTFRLPIVPVASLNATLEDLRARGIRIHATVPRDGTLLPRARLDTPAAILLGGEGPGLGPAVVALADDRLTIEMRSPVESLNVAVTAALILYEASRQRTHVAVR
jgi:TrmH family RNA methyltransferase